MTTLRSSILRLSGAALTIAFTRSASPVSIPMPVPAPKPATGSQPLPSADLVVGCQAGSWYRRHVRRARDHR